MPSVSDVGIALFSFIGIAVPIIASLYVGTRMAERRFEIAVCCVAAFSILLGGWAIALPTAFALENARCSPEHGCGMPQGERSD
jgi:hypothetical protein